MISYMKSKGRLSAALHALLHMAERGAPMTSEELAQCLHTHAVVVRRTMAGLRDAGFVVSERGHGGGWVLTRDLASVTLLDVHMAVDEPPPDAALVTPVVPECLVEQAVLKALDASLRQAADLLTKRLGQVTLADLARDFHAGMANHANHQKKADHAV